jgi:ubiquinone/menaquinone biosynthesis C-methylase UbiE
MQLEIGCGKRKKEGYIGVDIIKHPDVDYTLNLNTHVLPFNDNTVDEIFSGHCLEHLTPQGFLFCLDEMYRVSKPDAKWRIEVPYSNTTGSTANPYHTNNIFNEWTFYFFSPHLGPKEATTIKVSKDTANETTKTRLEVLKMDYLYFDEYRYLNELSEEEQHLMRSKYWNVALNIGYDLRVIK